MPLGQSQKKKKVIKDIRAIDGCKPEKHSTEK